MAKYKYEGNIQATDTTQSIILAVDEDGNITNELLLSGEAELTDAQYNALHTIFVLTKVDGNEQSVADSKPISIGSTRPQVVNSTHTPVVEATDKA